MTIRSCTSLLLASVVGLTGITEAISQRLCRPTLTINDVQFSPMQPPTLEQRIGDEAIAAVAGNEERIVHFEAEQHRKRRHADQRGEPIADGDAAEQDAGAEDGTDRRRIGAADETLDVRVLAPRPVPIAFTGDRCLKLFSLPTRVGMSLMGQSRSFEAVSRTSADLLRAEVPLRTSQVGAT
jgi:hypothetical protein